MDRKLEDHRSKRVAIEWIVWATALAVISFWVEAATPVADASASGGAVAGTGSVTVAYPADGTHNASLTETAVPGIGVVRLQATRNGTRVVVDAFGPEGGLVGRAEAVIGLEKTPIYLRTATGLRLLELRWK